MNKNLFPLTRLASVALCLAVICWLPRDAEAAAAHGHIYAGATSQTPGAPLFFQNGNYWDTNSYGGYAQSPACIYLDDNIPDVYPELFQTATTFAALPATIFNAGPSPYAAALGTYIELRFVSLQGPPGGALTLWNEIDDPLNPSVMFTLPAGAGSGTNQYNLSEGDPSDPESDPYGHIHGRRFTLNKPGLYVLGLQLVDTSHNGPGGGPVQSPSDVAYFYLQAGLCLSDFAVSNGVATARFGLPGLADYIFESSPAITGTNWSQVSYVPGNSYSDLRWVSDTNAAAPRRFYRVRPATN
jgi:hypothetical protein